MSMDRPCQCCRAHRASHLGWPLSQCCRVAKSRRRKDVSHNHSHIEGRDVLLMEASAVWRRDKTVPRTFRPHLAEYPASGMMRRCHLELRGHMGSGSGEVSGPVRDCKTRCFSLGGNDPLGSPLPAKHGGGLGGCPCAGFSPASQDEVVRGLGGLLMASHASAWHRL